MVVLGIDLGTKRVGIAIGNTELKIATGLDIIEHKSREKFIDRLKSIAENEGSELIVMGLPRNMDGSEGEMALKARQLADQIRSQLHIEVELTDERLTSAQAAKQIHALGGKVGDARGKIDMMSAILILQTYFDSQNS